MGAPRNATYPSPIQRLRRREVILTGIATAPGECLGISGRQVQVIPTKAAGTRIGANRQIPIKSWLPEPLLLHSI